MPGVRLADFPAVPRTAASGQRQQLSVFDLRADLINLDVGYLDVYHFNEKDVFMINMMRIAAVTTASLAVIPALAATQEELHEALVDNTFQGDMGGGGYSSYFAQDGTHHDSSTSGRYEITTESVCYPGTDYGCYQANIDGTSLEWMKDGQSAGTGDLIEGDALDLMAN